jgi:uncharacterized phage protein (TIGR01671 family)
MRKIKFRGWDKKKNEMWDDVLCEMAEFDNYDNDTSMLEIANCMIVGDNERFEFMQYTGLKDKNGKKIYEGDIIRVEELTYKGCEETLPENLEVQYYMDSFQFFRGDECLMGLYISYMKTGEIIGNIYENPELKEHLRKHEMIWR